MLGNGKDRLRGKTPLVFDTSVGAPRGPTQTMTITETKTETETVPPTPTQPIPKKMPELPKEKLRVSENVFMETNAEANPNPPPAPTPQPDPELPEFHGSIDEGLKQEEENRLQDLRLPPTGGGLWRTRANVGNWTGAIRPQYPRIRRPFGTNPREAFLGKRYTGMYQTGFDASVVESKATPPFIPSQRKMVQDGAPSITDYIPALRSGGSEHVFLGINHQRR